jgi:hypothetical protein
MKGNSAMKFKFEIWYKDGGQWTLQDIVEARNSTEAIRKAFNDTDVKLNYRFKVVNTRVKKEVEYSIELYRRR